jgi:hypothetical protein
LWPAIFDLRGYHDVKAAQELEAMLVDGSMGDEDLPDVQRSIGCVSTFQVNPINEFKRPQALLRLKEAEALRSSVPWYAGYMKREEGCDIDTEFTHPMVGSNYKRRGRSYFLRSTLINLRFQRLLLSVRLSKLLYQSPSSQSPLRLTARSCPLLQNV